MSSTDLVVPTTGELIDLDNPAQCARALHELGVLENRIKELKEYLRESVYVESERLGLKTIHFEEGYTAKVSTPRETVWDFEILQELVDAGLPEERYDALVTAEVTYKVNGTVLKQLQAANPTYGEIIERARTVIPRKPYVSVSGGS